MFPFLELLCISFKFLKTIDPVILTEEVMPQIYAVSELGKLCMVRGKLIVADFFFDLLVNLYPGKNLLLWRKGVESPHKPCRGLVVRKLAIFYHSPTYKWFYITLLIENPLHSFLNCTYANQKFAQSCWYILQADLPTWIHKGAMRKKNGEIGCGINQGYWYRRPIIFKQRIFQSIGTAVPVSNFAK